MCQYTIKIEKLDKDRNMCKVSITNEMFNCDIIAMKNKKGSIVLSNDAYDKIKCFGCDTGKLVYDIKHDVKECLYSLCDNEESS